MDYVLARVKGLTKDIHQILISDKKLFTPLEVDLAGCPIYHPDHNLDEDSWFKIEKFSETDYCLDLLKEPLKALDLNLVKKNKFSKLAYLVSCQDKGFYFQKLTPSFFIKKKTIHFGESVKLEENDARIVVNPSPDAVYFENNDVILFKSLATVSSIFTGIDELYREATKEEVTKFLDEPFVTLKDDFDVSKVSKPNLKRIALAMKTLKQMSSGDKKNLLPYINGYCEDTFEFDPESGEFSVSNDNELKLLLYGIEQRFYTTPFGKEKRLANSIQLI